MKKYFKTMAVSICFFLLSGCFSDPNEKANELYVRATEAISKPKEKFNYSKLFENYKYARSNIELILSEYPTSDIAVKLSSGETLISNFDIFSFREQENHLNQLAVAEGDIFSSLLLVINSIEDKEERDYTILSIAPKLPTIDALETTELINDQRLKALSLHTIALGIKTEDNEAIQSETRLRILNQATEAAMEIGDEYSKGEVLYWLAFIFSELSLFDEAEEITKNIKDGTWKVKSLTGLANRYYKTGKDGIASQLLYQALKTSNKIDSEYSKALALTNIAITYSNIGEKKLATDAFNEAYLVANSKSTGFFRSSAKASVALGYAEIGLFSKALEIAKSIEDDLEAQSLLVQISYEYAKSKQFTKALDLANTIKSENRMNNALASISQYHAENGQLNEALELSAMITNEFARAYALTIIAGKYADAGQKELSDNLITQVLELTKQAKSESDLDRALVEIAGIFIKSDRLSQALQTANMINSEDEKGSILAKIAGKYAEEGDFTQAIKLAKVITNKRHIAESLAEISANYSRGMRQNSSQGKGINLHEIVNTIYPISDWWKS